MALLVALLGVLAVAFTGASPAAAADSCARIDPFTDPWATRSTTW